MISNQQIQDLMANNAMIVDQQGEKIGKVEQIYLDDQTEQPEWATAKMGMFGSSESFVPLRGATVDNGKVTVQYDKDTIKDAPRIDAGEHLAPAQEDELYRHYGLDSRRDTGVAGRDRDDRAGREGTVGRDTSGPTTDEAMTRSEEHLNVGTERHEAGRARLRKYIVTEDVHTTVPVSREEVRVEREPITDANRGDALSGPELSEEEHEVTLQEEVPVVNKETRPVERVRLNKETTTDEAQVDEQVRKEEIDTDDVDRGNRR